MKKTSFPYCQGIEELYYRTVLIEKFDTKYNNKPPQRCCEINGIPVFTDKYTGKDTILYGRNGMNITFVLTGLPPEVIKTDSDIIQKILKVIQTTEDYRANEATLDSKSR